MSVGGNHLLWFERVFIEGEIDLLNKRRDMGKGENKMNFVSRDSVWAMRPEDILDNAEELGVNPDDCCKNYFFCHTYFFFESKVCLTFSQFFKLTKQEIC